MKRRIAFLVGALVTSTPISSARADEEFWLWVENRLPIIRNDKRTFPRLDWRFVSDTRINRRSDGLDQAFLRTGPLLFVTPWMFVATHGTIYADRGPQDRFVQEARVELEPNFFGRIGDFTLNDRNRLESRWRGDDQRFRYRNQLRVNYEPVGAKWIPFVWDELFFDLSGEGFNQNRAQIGIARMISESIRLDVGYMLRSRREPNASGQQEWFHDHILNVNVFFDVPPVAGAQKPPPPPAPATPAEAPR